MGRSIRRSTSGSAIGMTEEVGARENQEQEKSEARQDSARLETELPSVPEREQ
jgi:hypothetical protein